MSYDPSHSAVPAYTNTFGGAISAAGGTADAIHADGPFAPELPLTSTPISKKRKASKTKSSKQLPRSASTPQLSGNTNMSETDDKKRNKLGYQRISIACAHCRRRKIRCLLAEGDAQQRCQNCIRLKKECVFYPVEQQSAIEGRSDSSNKPDMGSAASSVVSSSPPHHGSETAFDQGREFATFPSLPSNAPSTFQRLPVAPGSALPSQSQSAEEAQLAPVAYDFSSPFAAIPSNFGQQNYVYHPHEQAHSTWSAPDRPDQILPQQHEMLPPNMNQPPQGVWSYGHPAAPGDFAPFPTTTTPVPHSPITHSPFAFNPQHRDESLRPQQPPMRSMSYGNIEQTFTSEPPSYSSTYSAPAASLRYPPPPQQPPEFSNPTMMLQEPASQSTPIGVHPHFYAQPPALAFNQDQQRSTNASLPSNPAYPGNWMAAPPPFGTLDEEPEMYGGRMQGHG